MVMAKAADTVTSIWAHPANSGERIRAVSRAVAYQFGVRMGRSRTQARLGEKSFVWVDVHRSSAIRVLYANPPDYEEMICWKKLLCPGDIYIDIGANIGAYSIWAAEQGAKVISIEPAEDTYKLLKENIDLNGYDITAIRAAVGANKGKQKFTMGKDTLNRLDPKGDLDIDVITIDEIVQDKVVAGMKVDVEGFELDVLRGGDRALSEQRISLIQLEWNRACKVAGQSDRRPVAELLMRCGYELLRPNRAGDLLPISRLDFGADVFARPFQKFRR